MADELTAALARLPCEDAFRLMYGAYVYLAGLEGPVPSSTHSLLRRVRDGQADAVLFCLKKMLEEQEEVRLTLAGRHCHEGRTVRQTLVNELQQLLYWPCLIAAGRGADYEAVRLPFFLAQGLAGREPTKGEFDDTGRDEVAVLRRAAVAVGRAVAEHNAGERGAAIEVREVALADLVQMAAREYLVPYLSAAGK
jgi:hypothetical protein